KAGPGRQAAWMAGAAQHRAASRTTNDGEVRMRWRFPVVVLVMGRKVSPGQDIRFCCPDNATDFPANTAAGVLLWQASSRHTGPPQLLLNGMLTQTLQEEIWQWVAA